MRVIAPRLPHTLGGLRRSRIPRFVPCPAFFVDFVLVIVIGEDAAVIRPKYHFGKHYMGDTFVLLALVF
jgi:hypothetical protein